MTDTVVRRVREEKSQEKEAEKSERERERVERRSAYAKRYRKVAKHCAFPKFGAPQGRKVGSLKRRVRSHLVR